MEDTKDIKDLACVATWNSDGGQETLQNLFFFPSFWIRNIDLPWLSFNLYVSNLS